MVTPPHVARPLRLEPFHGLTLAARRVGDPASARVFARPYRAASKRLDQWEHRGQLTRDEVPALYLHEYTSGGITIRGVVGALDVSRRASAPEQRAVFPHEGIHTAQADELAHRMAAMQLNPAPILLVHRGRAESRALLREIRKGRADHRFTDRAGQQHRIWAIRDPVRIDELMAAVHDARALIADGHHRYGAYLRMQRRDPGTAADRGLAMLVDQDDTPLFLGAIHRTLAGSTVEEVRLAAEAAGARFEEHARQRAVDSLSPDTIVVTDGARWASLRLALAPDRLAVESLHEDLVPALPRAPRRIGHHHSAEGALDHASPGSGVALLLPAPDVDTVLGIVASDRLLPEKATSFQPKPSVGALIRSLRAG